jgi:hypothetical protein
MCKQMNFTLTFVRYAHLTRLEHVEAVADVSLAHQHLPWLKLHLVEAVRQAAQVGSAQALQRRQLGKEGHLQHKQS